MRTKSTIHTADAQAFETAAITLGGREYTAGGFAIDMDRGRMIGYVHAEMEGYTLTTWDGQTVARLKRTDNHARQNYGYYGLRGSGPVGFHGTSLQSFRTLDPIAGFHWYGRGLGAGMVLKLRRGRKTS